MTTVETSVIQTEQTDEALASNGATENKAKSADKRENSDIRSSGANGASSNGNNLVAARLYVDVSPSDISTDRPPAESNGGAHVYQPGMQSFGIAAPDVHRTLDEVRTLAQLRRTTLRTQRLNDRIQQRMTHQQMVWGEQLDIFTEPGVADMPLVIRRALALRKLLLEMPIAIEPDDLIVGNSVQHGVIVRTSLPKYGTDEEYTQAQMQGSALYDQLSHKTPFYYDVMKKGLSGIIVDLDAKIAEIKSRPPCAERTEKLNLFRAMKIEVRAVISLSHRYAGLATLLSDKAPTLEKRTELRRIARVCRQVPEYPPSTFREAVQSFWMIHYALFSTGTHISCGRLDQFLYPSLRWQINMAAITMPEAQELVDCLWLRFNDRAQIVRDNFYTNDSSLAPHAAESEQSQVQDVKMIVESGPIEWTAGHRKRFRFATDAADAINHFGQNILLSGVQPDGRDGTNELTYLCLNSLEKFAYTSPVVTARLHKESPPELVRRIAEVLRSGGGMPYINNDDVLIPAYERVGIPVEDARDYANSNCWETMIEGKSDQEMIRGMNFLLFLELAMNRGVSTMHGEMGPDTGDPREFTSFEQLMDAWKEQTDFQIQQGIRYIGEGIRSGELEHSGHGRYSYNPLLSALTHDCIENERDVIRGGARYTIWHVMGEAVANTIDAMAAIKRSVYDEQSITMDELLNALEADWEGYETLRAKLVARAPKYATDNDYADAIGHEMMSFFIDRATVYAAEYPEIRFPCSIGTFSWYAMIGKEVGATPDGRYCGSPIAANFSPVPGTDMAGPTAAINSYVKMNVDCLAAGAPLDLRLSASSVAGDAGVDRLAGLLSAFTNMGGNMVTLTVTDVEELKRAMEEPEKYRHLRVRMGGWSAYFVMLSREQQLLHIQRVEHGLA